MLNRIKYWLLVIFYPEMPFCVYPIFRKGKAGYDSWMIKGYSYVLLVPNKDTKNVVHLGANDFAMHEEHFLDEEDKVFSIEDTDQPFFENWADAFNEATVMLNRIK